MAFKKGNTFGKGRPKGSSNKNVMELREFYKEFLVNDEAQFLKDWKALEPKERVRYRIDLNRFIIPSLRAVTETIDNLSDEQFERLYQRLKQEHNL